MSVFNNFIMADELPLINRGTVKLWFQVFLYTQHT